MNTSPRYRLPPIVVSVALALVASPGGAQAPGGGDPTVLFQKGRAAVEKGEFKVALRDLEASHRLLPSPNTLLLIAHAKRGLGRRADALRDYERTLTEAEAKLKGGEQRFAATANDARRWVQSLPAELARITVRVTDAPAGTSLQINGVAAEPKNVPPQALVLENYWVEPGKVTVRAEAGSETKELTLDVAKASSAAFALDFKPKDTSPAPIRSAAPAETPPPRSTIPGGAWVAGGVGAAGLAVFGVFGSMAKSNWDELKTCSPACPESKRSVADSGKSNQTVANVGLIVGGIGLATAVGLIVFRSKAPKQTTEVSVGPGTLQLQGSF